MGLGCLLGTVALFERLVVESMEYGVSLVLLPIVFAWLINTILWRAMERSAALVADCGTATSYSASDAVFPAWARMRDAVFIAILMLKSTLKAVVFLLVGSTTLGFFLG